MKNHFKSKRQLFLFFFIILELHFLKTYSQTWVKTSNYEVFASATLHHDTLPIGPLEMCQTPNGNIISIVRIDQNQTNELIKIDSIGNLSWNLPISQSGGIYSERAFGLHPTMDNGCVYTFWHLNAGYDVSNVYKMNASGGVSWMKTSSYPIIVYAIVPTSYNTYLLQYNQQDSLVEVSSTGAFIRNRFPFVGTIATMNDSDFVVFSTTNITRQDFNGNIKWTFNIVGFLPISVDTNIIYCKYGTTIMKLNTKDGTQIWSKSISHDGISLTKDSGLIACGGIQADVISKYDTSGNPVWSRTIPFPEWGYKDIIEAKANSYITGGAYPCSYLISQNSVGHSFFLMSVDSSGHGAIDSTDHYFNGNANDNTKINFADDGAFMGAALGNSGSPRSNILQDSGLSFSVFGTDWPGQFPVGINYKYSDFDGNGIINISDISSLSATPSYIFSVPSHWKLANFNNSLPEIKLSFANDTIPAGDTAIVYIVVGSNSLFVDSIYSISMSIGVPNSFQNGMATDNLPNSGFGNSGINLKSYLTSSTLFASPCLNYLIYKTDHINATLNGDTISVLRIPTSTTLPSTPFSLICYFHAITKGGYDVVLNYVSDSVYFYNPLLDIGEIPTNEFNIFPNPSTGYFKFHLKSETINALTIYNSIGEEIIRKENGGNSMDIIMSDYPEGFYYVQCLTQNKIFNTKILVIH